MTTLETTRVAFEGTTKLDFDTTVERCRAELAEEGFGVLTEIDVKATLKEKLDIDTDPYLILGACNPPLAHKALEAAPEVGVLLPCNVTVSREGGRTVVRAMNPESVLSLLDRDDIEEVARTVGTALSRVVTAVTD